MSTEPEYFAQAAAHRRRTADILEGLTPEQWATPSLCGNWTVQQVAGHLTAGWNIGMGKFMWGLVKARGDFNVANSRFAEQLGSRSPAEIIADLRDNADDRFTPPGIGSEAPLSDAFVHALDMFIPLGIDYDVPLADIEPIMPVFVTKKSRRVRGNDYEETLSWRATDSDWSHINDGAPEISGPILALLLALYGRGDALGQLEGAVDRL